MPAAQIIAQILGPLYLIVAAGLLLNSRAYARVITEFIDSPALLYLGGFLALVFGLVILAFHSAWRADWTVIVTLFGWLALIKGALLVAYPEALLRFYRRLAARPDGLRAWAIPPLVLGLFFSAAGYGLI